MRRHAAARRVFRRTPQQFDLTWAPRGIESERALWSLLRKIPDGELRTDGNLAASLNSDPREVGRACGRNPLPIPIRCHRAVASQSLGGYSGRDGLVTKRRLLALERRDPAALPPFASRA